MAKLTFKINVFFSVLLFVSIIFFGIMGLQVKNSMEESFIEFKNELPHLTYICYQNSSFIAKKDVYKIYKRLAELEEMAEKPWYYEMPFSGEEKVREVRIMLNKALEKELKKVT